MSNIYNDKGTIYIHIAIIIMLAAMAIVAYGPMQEAEAVLGGIGNVTDSNNPHNLSAGSSGVAAISETQVCVFCHTPHTAITDATIIDAPLWNHSLSSATYADTRVVGSVVDGGTAGWVKMYTTPNTTPDGASRMCLSCHDGTMGLGAVNSKALDIQMDTSGVCTSAASKMDPGCYAYIGTNLTNKHLVSIAMNAQLKTDSAASCGTAGQTSYVKYPWEAPNAQPTTVYLRPTTATYSANPGVTTASAVPAMPANSLYTAGYNYGVQCSSCHDPHLWGNGAAVGSTGYRMLVIDTNSLCQACHLIPSPPC